MQIAVLGAGMVGRTMALDLATSHAVTSFDASADNLALLQTKNNNIKIQQANLTDYSSYQAFLNHFDFVVCALPGFMSFKALQAIINAGKNVVDISFFAEDGLQLDALAKQKNVTAIFDCGVAPGMGNFILGHHAAQQKIHSFECMVGGLPKVRQFPFQYKAPFSPIDVLEEYTRPARYIENGQIVTKPALSDVAYEYFEGIGTLESFNTDGLRSILYTMPQVPNIKEKTLRYPGHINLIQALIATNFLSTEPININGTAIKPIDFTSQLLFKNWQLGPTEPEFTVMKIVLQTETEIIEYHLYDEYDATTQTSSMSRTTGYTATAAVALVNNQIFTQKGAFPPELVGQQTNTLPFIMDYLAKRNVVYCKTQRTL
jgi:lysine 6-dehydrogenase